MDLQTLIELDKELLLWFNGSPSLFLDGLVKTLTTAGTWIPFYVALFYMVLKNNESVQKIMLIVACAGLCVVLAGTFNDTIIKPFVGRWRPGRDPDIGMLVDVVNDYRSGNYGFFSSHACNTFSVAVFMSLLVRHRLFSVFVIGWSLVNCWTRLYLGVHFPGDILCGLVWGSIVGTSVWYFCHRLLGRMSTGMNYISEKYTSTGYAVKDVDVVIVVLVFTLLYAILRACFYLYV